MYIQRAPFLHLAGWSNVNSPETLLLTPNRQVKPACKFLPCTGVGSTAHRPSQRAGSLQKEEFLLREAQGGLHSRMSFWETGTLDKMSEVIPTQRVNPGGFRKAVNQDFPVGRHEVLRLTWDSGLWNSSVLQFSTSPTFCLHTTGNIITKILSLAYNSQTKQGTVITVVFSQMIKQNSQARLKKWIVSLSSCRWNEQFIYLQKRTGSPFMWFYSSGNPNTH